MIIKNDKVAVSRYPDLTEEEKEELVNTYSLVVNEDVEKLWAFLNFEEEDDEFCS